MQDTNDVLRVPLNREKFRSYRNMNAVMAALGVGGILLVLSFFAPVFTRTKDLNSLLPAVFMGICVVLMIGLPILPAWQLACCQTKVLKNDLPALVVDQEGIQDNASNYTFGRITWTEIESITATSRYAPRIKEAFPGVAIVLKDRNSLLQKKSKMVAMWMQSDDEIMKKRQVFIPQGRLRLPVDEVVKFASEFLGQRQSYK